MFVGKLFKGVLIEIAIVGSCHEIGLEMFGGGSVGVLGLEFDGFVLKRSSSTTKGFGLDNLAGSLG